MAGASDYSYIAKRTFAVENGETHEMELRLYAPVADGDDYRCSYEIIDQGLLVRRGDAWGVDSLQALILALQKSGADITLSDFAREQRLFWNGQNIDLGLLMPKGV